MSAPAWPHWLAVAAGATLGAWLRWVCGLWLQASWPGFPLGTLVVNLIGGLLIGVTMVGFEHAPHEGLRLFVVTGFLGGLTTFSAFSGESLALLQRAQWTLAAAHTAAHTVGALLAAGLGFAAARSAWRALA